jgi:hypothetical protein
MPPKNDPSKSLGLEQRFSIDYIRKEADSILRCLYDNPEDPIKRAKKRAITALITDDDIGIALTNLKHSRKEVPMDKQINKVKQDIEQDKKVKAKKDVNDLLKMDKKFDKKLDKCDDMMKKGKK